MALFKLEQTKVIRLQGITLAKEKNIQIIFEENLDTILDVTFLHTEYKAGDGRIDSIGIDKYGSPVIVEYKKTKDENVIIQALSYLTWLLDHKADFKALCAIKKVGIEIDWESPRVLCVAESFNKHDLNAVKFLQTKVGVEVELLTYKVYESGLLYIEPKNIEKKTQASEESDSDTKSAHKILRQVYDLEHHFAKASAETKNMLLNLRERIFSLDSSIVEEPKQNYIAYKLTTNFVDITMHKNYVLVYLNVPTGKLDDPYRLARDLETPKHIGHWGNGDYDIHFDNLSQIDKVFELIKQSYVYNK